MIQTTLFPNTFRQIFSLSNDDIACVFEQVADLLEAQGNDYYRIRAYRKGADAVRQQQRPVVDLFEAEGTEGLETIPYIGRGLAQAIAELAITGDLSLLSRLSIDVSPEDLFTQVSGIGQVFARRLYRGLGLHTLAELETAAKDGTLARVPGFGPERINTVLDGLEALWAKMPSQARTSEQQRPKQSAPAVTTKDARSRRWQPDISSGAPSSNSPVAVEVPSVELLLEVDRQYQQLAKAGQLRMITPRRFNPDGKQWLPVMTLKRDGWAFNVLYSNTARAHELDKTDDWVVINYEPIRPTGQQKGQCTVVTETRGVRRGQRVVRGLAIAAA